VGVGVSSSVIPYISDQLALRRLARATYALMVSLLPATAVVIGVVVLGQVPSPTEIAGVALVVIGVALHRETGEAASEVVREPRHAGTHIVSEPT
jgi:inner membrane transporter RhtA